MTYQSSNAYACVAYRIMEYEGQEMSEEYLSILMEMLYNFYTESEIKKIYLDNIRVDAYEAMLKLVLTMSKKYHFTYQFTTIHSSFYSLFAFFNCVLNKW